VALVSRVLKSQKMAGEAKFLEGMKNGEDRAQGDESGQGNGGAAVTKMEVQESGRAAGGEGVPKKVETGKEMPSEEVGGATPGEKQHTLTHTNTHDQKGTHLPPAAAPGGEKTVQGYPPAAARGISMIGNQIIPPAAARGLTHSESPSPAAAREGPPAAARGLTHAETPPPAAARGASAKKKRESPPPAAARGLTHSESPSPAAAREGPPAAARGVTLAKNPPPAAARGTSAKKTGDLELVPEGNNGAAMSAGVGLVLKNGGAKFVVESLVAGGGAACEGTVKPGDVLLQVEGVSAAGQTLATLVPSIKGPTGTSVRLVLERQGQPYTVCIKRIAPGGASPSGFRVCGVFLRMLVALIEFIADRASRRDAPDVGARREGGSGSADGLRARGGRQVRSNIMVTAAPWDAGATTRNLCASAAEIRIRRGQTEDANPPEDMPPSSKDAESSVASSVLGQEMDIAEDAEGHIRSQDSAAAAHGDEPAHG
jgi:hypothetical protein